MPRMPSEFTRWKTRINHVSCALSASTILLVVGLCNQNSIASFKRELESGFNFYLKKEFRGVEPAIIDASRTFMARFIHDFTYSSV